MAVIALLADFVSKFGVLPESNRLPEVGDTSCQERERNQRGQIALARLQISAAAFCALIRCCGGNNAMFAYSQPFKKTSYTLGQWTLVQRRSRCEAVASAGKSMNESVKLPIGHVRRTGVRTAGLVR